MSTITTAQIAAAYSVAASVYDEAQKPEDGTQLLSKTHGLNENTARDFIMQFRMLMNGKEFKRAMSAEALEYFLTRIRADRGERSLEHAIAAARQHITYYESQAKSRLKKSRAVIAAHEAALPPVQTAVLTAVRFDSAVQQSLSDTSAKRQARLAAASKTPTKIIVTSTAFVRNADVVAEVLLRAKGKCEWCLQAAPFVKKSNGAPYLEVHHKVPLADGGDDTVDNAEALCPNCHRKRHHG